jgi:hypothetical protein
MRVNLRPCLSILATTLAFTTLALAQRKANAPTNVTPDAAAAAAQAIAEAEKAVAQRALQNVSLDAHIRQVIGPDAVDCGTFTVRPPPVPEAMRNSIACARDATKQKKAFRFVQYVQGIDSAVAFGVLGERDGSTAWFSYDSAPCGGPDCGELFVTTRCTLDEVAVADEPNGRHQFRRVR